MYCRKHQKLSPEQGIFWDYSTIDMPSMIDFVLAKTGYKQVLYAGHSMATTMLFVMTSKRPEYNAKVKHMFGLAPVAYCGNLQTPVREFAPNIRFHQELMKSTMNNHIPAELIVFQLGKYGLCSIAQSMCVTAVGTLGGVNPNTNVSDVAQNHGYQADTHDVTTPDGYILNVQRIRNKTVQISEPIVLVHCITCNAGIWMLQEPPNNIVFLLADAGYDVWLPSLRGSQFSRKHNRLSPHSAEFWDFGWHEHGVLDMPSVIDHILNETHSKQVHYVGYSMGTTTFFVMTSMLPEYNAKIKHMYALTPVAYCGNVRSVIRLFAPGIRFWNNLMEALLRNHVPLEMELIKVIKELFCTYVSRNVCLYINDAIMGHNPTRNEGAMTSFLLYYPDAASAKQLTHYAQLINHPYTFRLFDYGEENWERYNSSVPPAYPIHNIKTPMTFFYSKNDALGALEDVEEFSKKLHNVTLYLVEDPKYNHLDYVLSASVNEEINMPLLKMLQSHLRR